MLGPEEPLFIALGFTVGSECRGESPEMRLFSSAILASDNVFLIEPVGVK